MKTCNRGHRHDESFCPMCRKITRDARYWRNAESIKAKKAAERAEYISLKAADQAAKEIAASQ